MNKPLAHLQTTTHPLPHHLFRMLHREENVATVMLHLVDAAARQFVAMAAVSRVGFRR